MIRVAYKPNDLRYIFMKSDNHSEMIELEKYLNKIPQYMFLPSFRGIPRPEVFLNKHKTNKGDIIYYSHSGLWKNIYDWCNEHNIDIHGIDDNFKYTKMNMSLDEFIEYVYSWNLNITPREYQIKAAWLILKYRQSLSELATRAGKTLIAYLVFRYMLEHGAHNILMIVPSIQLVKQGVADMKEYKEFFKSETVWAKSEICESSNLTIGTFQSLVLKADPKSSKYDPKFFDKFDVVCVDEAHHLVCKSINMILGLNFMKNIKLKFGFTGTLPKENTIESFACHSLMGPKIQNISAKDLVDEGFLAKPNITQIYIKYDWNDELYDQYIKCGEYLCSSYKMVDKKRVLLPKDQREFTIQHEKELPFTLKQVRTIYEKHEYSKYLIDLCKSNGSNLLNLEQMLVHRSEKHIKVIFDIIDKINKNCIVFAHHGEYLDYLKMCMEARYPNKHVYIIKGNISLKKRQKIVDDMTKYNDVILVASYGCCSTGITFKNVDYGIFAQSFKSEIINKQSLGRLMLKNNEKDEFFLYDIVDVFPTKKLYTQGIAKGKTYKNEGYVFSKIDIK